MSPQPPALTAIIGGARRLLQRRVARALLATTAALAPLVLALAWVGGTRWRQPSPWPLLLELAALGVAAALFVWWRRVLRPRLDERAVASAAEDRLGLPRGAVGGILELQRTLPVGSSMALARRAEASLSATVSGHRPAELTGALGERWRRRERGALIGLIALVGTVAMLGFAAPERTRAGWAPLLHPVKHLNPPALAPLAVAPGDAEVARGAALGVRVHAPGRDAVVLKWRLAGDVLHEVVLPVTRDSARGEISAVDAPGRYWVEAPDGARSARFQLRPVDALLISELAFDVVFPSYLERPAEHHQGELPPLELPAGTTLRIRGRATRPLRRAALEGANVTSELQVSGDRFEGRWTPVQSGVYRWSLRAERAVPGVAPGPIEIVIVPDQPPTVTITVPGADTIIPADLRQPIVAEARDDHGLAGAMLVSWRVSSAGVADSMVIARIAVDRAERTLLGTVLDLSGRGLLPGDTLKYFLRVNDASPAGQIGESAIYALRLPTAEQLRLRARDQARVALAQAQALTTDAAALASRTRDAERRAQGANARRAQRSDARPGASNTEQAGGRMDFAETEAARAVLRDQELLLDRLAQLRESTTALEKSVTEAGLRDRELQAQLDELRALTEQLLTPELQQQLEALQKSLQNLDGAQLQQALERLAQQQQDLRQQLERQLEAMRRAAAAQELGSLAQQARELAAQQQALAMAHQQPPPQQPDGERAAAQERLAQQAEELVKDLEDVDRELGAEGTAAAREQTAQAARRARAAQSAMQQAARSADDQRGEDAARQGRQAAAQLEEAAASLEQARSGTAGAGRDEAREAMEQASREALELAQRQLELQQRMRNESGEGEPESPSADTPELPRPGAQPTGEAGGSSSLPRPAIPQGTGAQSGQQGNRSGQASARQAEPQGGAQQGGAQPGGAQPGGAQPGGAQPGGAQPGGAQPGGTQPGGAQPGAAQSGAGGQRRQASPGNVGRTGTSLSAAELAQMQAEQGALQDGLGQLADNVAASGTSQGALSRDVTAAMGRANLAMRQTQQGLEEAGESGELPVSEAGQSVESLNRLALALLNNARQLEQAQGGSGGGQARQQLADLAQAQASLNGQGSSLLPLGLEQGATADQARRLGREQQQLAQRLGGMNNLPGGREDVLGELDLLAREADALARELQGGRIPPEVIARQERLFHRLLDAGRALEREDTSEEREAERPGPVPPSVVAPLDPALLRDARRYRQPTPEELRTLPPAYRRLVLEYFDRLNRPLPPTGPPD